MKLPIYAIAFAACLSSAVPAQAANAYARFFNVSGTRVKVVILHSDAKPRDYSKKDVHKEQSIAKGDSHTFEFTTKRTVCRKARKFAIHRDSPDSDELIGWGRFTFAMDPGAPSSGCNLELIDSDASAGFPQIQVDIEREAGNQVDVSVKTN